MRVEAVCDTVGLFLGRCYSHMPGELSYNCSLFRPLISLLCPMGSGLSVATLYVLQQLQYVFCIMNACVLKCHDVYCTY